jgi:anti-sigma factor RsiW
MNNSQNSSKIYDDVTFALYFDHELDQSAESEFEAALNSNPELLAQYEDWVATYEMLNAHFEAREAQYSLEGFTDRVMGELPETLERTQRGEAEPAELEEVSLSARLRSILVPFFAGCCVAAVIFMILQRPQPSHPSAQSQPDSLAAQPNSLDEVPVANEVSDESEVNDDEEDEDGEGNDI